MVDGHLVLGIGGKGEAALLGREVIVSGLRIKVSEEVPRLQKIRLELQCLLCFACGLCISFRRFVAISRGGLRGK